MLVFMYDEPGKTEPQQMDESRIDHDLERLAQLVAEKLPRQTSGWDRRLSGIVAMFSLAAVVFSAGIYWSQVANNGNQISDLRQQVNGLTSELRSTQERLSTQTTDVRVLDAKLSQLQATLEEVRRLVGGRPREDARVPTFGR